MASVNYPLILLLCKVCLLGTTCASSAMKYKSFGDAFNGFIPKATLMSGRAIETQDVVAVEECSLFCASQPLCVSYEVTPISSDRWECVTRNNLIVDTEWLTQVKTGADYYYKGLFIIYVTM